VLGTGLFSLSEAEKSEQWLKEARHGEHTPESEEYGIQGFTFKARRPFHPQRLRDVLNRLQASAAPRLVVAAAAPAGGEEAANAQQEATSLLPVVPDDDSLAAVVRAKGPVYVATPGGRDCQAILSLAGRVASLTPGPLWWASLDESEWPEELSEAIKPLWDEEHGERQSEFVVIGVRMDREAVEAALRTCLLTDAEARVPVGEWKSAWADPFKDDWDKLLAEAEAEAASHNESHGHDHGHEHSHEHSHEHKH